MPFTCPVCGYPDLTEPPRNPISGGASHEICPSCDYQFGYTDDLLEIDYETWRRQWIAEGMPWRDVEPAPAGWDPAAQLRALEQAGEEGRHSESGQALIEFGGVLVVVALIVAAVVWMGIPGQVAGGISRSVGSIFGAGVAHGATGTGGGGAGAGPGAEVGAGTGGNPGNAGGAAGGAGATGTGQGSSGAGSGPLASRVQSAAANAQRLVDSGGDAWGNPSTLARHFRDHGSDYGAQTPEEYAKQAQDLLQRAVSERLPTKVDPTDGTIRVWDPRTDEFGAYNADGTTKTYYDIGKNSNGNRPPGRAQRYWDKQPGEDPWAEPGSGSGSSEGNSGSSEGGTGSGGSSSGGGSSNGGGSGAGEPGGEAPAVPEAPAPDVPVPDIPIPDIPIIP